MERKSLSRCISLLKNMPMNVSTSQLSVTVTAEGSICLKTLTAGFLKQQDSEQLKVWLNYLWLFINK